LDGAAGEEDSEILSYAAQDGAYCKNTQGEEEDLPAAEDVREVGEERLHDARCEEVGRASPEGVGGFAMERYCYDLA